MKITHYYLLLFVIIDKLLFINVYEWIQWLIISNNTTIINLVRYHDIFKEKHPYMAFQQKKIS